MSLELFTQTGSYHDKIHRHLFMCNHKILEQKSPGAPLSHLTGEGTTAGTILLSKPGAFAVTPCCLIYSLLQVDLQAQMSLV